MAALPTYFDDFLTDIRLTPAGAKAAKNAHEVVRKQLQEWPEIKAVLVDAFLQGSYRRATIIRPANGKQSDVDIVAVTRLLEDEHSPEDAIQRFEKFLDVHYVDKETGERLWHRRDRALAISFPRNGAHEPVELDLVVTSAPSEAVEGFLQKSRSGFPVDGWLFEDADGDVLEKSLTEAATWQLEPLRIPDRHVQAWQDTDPLTQYRWTVEKNRACHGHYVNVVKAIKWWARTASKFDRPRGYLLEAIVGAHCPDVDSVALGVACSLEAIRDNYASFVRAGRVPALPDLGTDANVLARLELNDFLAFHAAVTDAATLARLALDETDAKKSARQWYELLGDPFPPPRDDSSRGGFSPPRRPPPTVNPGRFA